MPAYRMPKVDLAQLGSKLDADDLAIAMLTLNSRTGELRASKPEVQDGDRRTGIAAYAWRMAAFSVSPNPKHQCMPVCADFDLPDLYPHSWYSGLTQAQRDAERDYRKQMMAWGNRIEDAIVKSVDVHEWHGVRRWGQVFGVVGTPQYNAEGAVIYR